MLIFSKTMASVRPASPVVLALLIALCVGVIKGQGRESCPSLTSNECYFEGAATVPPDEPNPAKRFIVGGFFDIHKKGTNAYSCSDEMSMEGLMNMQAFMWGIDFYAARHLPNSIRVGVVAFDSCMRPEQNIENMLSYAQCKLYLQSLPQTNLVAYVGPYSNEAVEHLSHLATDLSVPLLAPTANSDELEGAGNEYLLQLSPQYKYDVGAIYSLLRKLQVDYVIILYDAEDPRYATAHKNLSGMLKVSETCVQYERAYTVAETASVVDDLERRQIVRYVVPLMGRDKLDSLLEGVKARPQIMTNSFRFILNSEVGQDRAFMASKSVTVNNSLIIEQTPSQAYTNDLQLFAQELNMKRGGGGQVARTNISFITEFYQRYGFNERPSIDSDTPSHVVYSVAKTLEAVEGIMKGMKAVLADCGTVSNQNIVCDQYRNQPGKGNALLSQISRALGDAAVPNVMAPYDVYHYFVPRTNTAPVFEMVATIAYGNGVMTTSLQKNLLDTLQFGTQFTDSACPGEGECCIPPTTVPPPTTPGSEATEPEQTTEDPDTSKMVMVRYPRGQEITGAYFDADREDGEYGTRFDLNHKWIIALGVLAGLGILSVVIFEIYILYKLLGTRMGNKWRTMWLGQLLLFGVLLCYVTLFAYIPIPTKATCGITRFGVGVSYAICFAVLLVKLMVILTSRSTSEVLLPGDVESPNYLKGIYQFLMFIFAVGVQVVIDVQWLITVPPEAVPVTANNGERVWVCNHYTWEAGQHMDRMDGWVRTNFENHLLSLCYIMVMILITTLLSLNAHGIITNHRESIFIGIAAGFSIPIWLAWGLVGGLNSDHAHAHEFGDACIAFGLFLTATLILFAMFLPKVRQLVNMGVEGIYLEDDRDTYYAGSVIMAPPSYKSKGPNSVIYVNNQGIYSEPVIIGNGDPSKINGATHLRHPGSTYSAPPNFVKKAESAYGGSRVLRVTDDLKGRHPQKPRTQSEFGYGTAGRPRSNRGTMPRSRSQTNLGAL